MMKRILGVLVLLALVVFAACGRRARGAEILILSIGKADAILVTHGKRAVLIDAGEDGDGAKVLAYLRAKNIAGLDAMIVTHFDKDHVGGADWVLDGIPVGVVYDADYEADSKQYLQYVRAIRDAGTARRRVGEEMAVSFDGLVFTLMPTALASEDDNDLSLVVSLSDGFHTFLFMADATEPRIAELLENGLSPHDFLKLPHHGQYKGNLPALLDAVNPWVAVVTDSEKNPASGMTMRVLGERGIKTYSTRDGDVFFVSDGKGLGNGIVPSLSGTPVYDRYVCAYGFK